MPNAPQARLVHEWVLRGRLYRLRIDPAMAPRESDDAWFVVEERNHLGNWVPAQRAVYVLAAEMDRLVDFAQSVMGGGAA